MLVRHLLHFLVAAFGICIVQGGKNPCHPYGIKEEPANCDKVILPKGICTACKIRNVAKNGNYNNCTDTMILDSDGQCLNLLNTYLNLNPCDDKRAVAVTQYTSSDMAEKEVGRLKLDYFLYSMCENGCDCIPQQNAERDTPAFDVNRGNCQAHAFADICRVFPDVKQIRLEGTTDEDVSNYPKACDLLTEWHDSDAGFDWESKPSTTVDDDVKIFLEKLAEAEELLESTEYWNACMDLELTQRRISEALPPADCGDGFPYEIATSRNMGKPTITSSPVSGDFVCPNNLKATGRRTVFRLRLKDCNGNQIPPSSLVINNAEPKVHRIMKLGANGELNDTGFQGGTMVPTKKLWKQVINAKQIGGQGCYLAEFEFELLNGKTFYANSLFKTK